MNMKNIHGYISAWHVWRPYLYFQYSSISFVHVFLTSKLSHHFKYHIIVFQYISISISHILYSNNLEDTGNVLQSLIYRSAATAAVEIE